MFQVSITRFINRPIEEVFEFIADNENDPQWCVPVLTTDRTHGEQPGPDTRYVFTSDAGFFTARGEINILEFKPPNLISWKMKSTINTSEGRYVLDEKDGGTQITETATLHPKWYFKLAESRMKAEIEKSLNKQLDNLKELLEVEEH